MKLTYWAAENLGSGRAYNVRAKTRTAALAQVAERGGEFGPVVKVTVTYRDGFDLVLQALGEGGLGSVA